MSRPLQVPVNLNTQIPLSGLPILLLVPLVYGIKKNYTLVFFYFVKKLACIEGKGYSQRRLKQEIRKIRG